MTWIENVATAIVTITAAVLSVISLRAYLHTRSGKVLLLFLGFLIFLAKGILLSVGLYFLRWGSQLLTMMVLLDVAILAVFYLSILKRSRL